MTPFDIIKSFDTHQYLDDISAFKPFVIYKGLSFSEDTIKPANRMNINYQLDYRMQYDFLFYTIKSKNRYRKWFKNKKDKDGDLGVVREYYGYNAHKARQALTILSKPQIEKIKELLIKGG